MSQDPSKPKRPSHPAPQFSTKAAHYKEVLADASAPKPALEVSLFFDAVVESAMDLPPGEMLPSDVPCMAGPRPRKWCIAVVFVRREVNPLSVHWECPLCGRGGVISGFDEVPQPPSDLNPDSRLH